MNQWVILLRGINVGGHRRVAMADLKRWLADASFTDINTYIQSGNVVLRTPEPTTELALRDSIMQLLEAKCGFPIDVVALSAERFNRILDQNPFPEAASDTPDKLLVLCVQEQLNPPHGIIPMDSPTGELCARTKEAAYVVYPSGAGASKLRATQLRDLCPHTTTARNWNTMQKLRALLM